MFQRSIPSLYSLARSAALTPGKSAVAATALGVIAGSLWRMRHLPPAMAESPSSYETTRIAPTLHPVTADRLDRPRGHPEPKPAHVPSADEVPSLD